ncbi:MAG: ATP-dependent RNA helicase DbpA [Owenweeksia sp. TMED14]|nr:MAG: ATP-dependent RNA helicase DbpA [Owenweeksia sp. TMED14]
MKSQKEILLKLGIESLNDMQVLADDAILNNDNVILLSPTGTGKTLAFLLPVIEKMNHEIEAVQTLIVVPSRELAIQIEQVIREMGTGFKCNSVYGGQSFNQDRINLKHVPSIVVGTPGRLADHLSRNTFSLESIKTIVLDEFDKSLEIGFEEELKIICSSLYHVKKRILTSATNKVDIPRFVNLETPKIINNLKKGKGTMDIRAIVSSKKDKLESLAESLLKLDGETGILFCNYKDSINRVSDFLSDRGIEHGCFYGGLEQNDRELSLIKFRNGSHRLIIATDLAARGLDIHELDYIMHYHLPAKEHEFLHRNGRTARMHNDGTVYILHHSDDKLPDFIPKMQLAELEKRGQVKPVNMKTIMISGGRRDRISKGDVAGFCLKQGGADLSQLGLIELQQKNSFVAVSSDFANQLIEKLDRAKLKTKKVRATLV